MEINYKQAHRIIIRDSSGIPVAELTDADLRTRNGYTVEVERPETDYATLEDIERIASPVLLPRQIAAYLKCSPYTINCQAQQAPDRLGFPVIVAGSRVKIPKDGFINFCKAERGVS